MRRVAVAFEDLSTGRMYQAGQVVEDDDPALEGRAHLFTDGDPQLEAIGDPQLEAIGDLGAPATKVPKSKGADMGDDELKPEDYPQEMGGPDTTHDGDSETEDPEDDDDDEKSDEGDNDVAFRAPVVEQTTAAPGELRSSNRGRGRSNRG